MLGSLEIEMNCATAASTAPRPSVHMPIAYVIASCEAVAVEPVFCKHHFSTATAGPMVVPFKLQPPFILHQTLPQQAPHPLPPYTLFFRSLSCPKTCLWQQERHN